jgi:hypothetical protein
VGGGDQATGVRRRGYRRKQAEQVAQASERAGQSAQQVGGPVELTLKAQQQEMSAPVLLQVQAELAEQRGTHGWGKAWSIRRQRELATQREQQRPTIVG